MHFSTHIRLTILLGLCLFLFAEKAHSQQVALKTNLLSLAALTPDIGLELVTGEHTSVAVSAFGHIRPYGIESRMAVVQPEFRYWFNGRPLTREYIGLAAFASAYDMTIGGHVYAGNAIAAGISGGYVFNLSRRCGLELSAGTGVLVFRQKLYREGDRYDEYFQGKTSTANSRGYKLFPVKAAVTFIYIIK